VLGRKLEGLASVVRAKPPQRLPQILSRGEVAAILSRLHGSPRLMAALMYGAGLRLLECARLRIKDVDFERWPNSHPPISRTTSRPQGHRDLPAAAPTLAAAPFDARRVSSSRHTPFSRSPPSSALGQLQPPSSPHPQRTTRAAFPPPDRRRTIPIASSAV
jgi:integrase